MVVLIFQSVSELFSQIFWAPLKNAFSKTNNSMEIWKTKVTRNNVS